MKTCPTCREGYPNNYAICPADGSPLKEVSIWSEGSVIRGKYRIVSKVGQGGMGSVYKAVHVAFNEDRALKVIAPELLTDELFVKRFKHEAVITRRLQHVNAVRVDDIDEAEDGRPFIVMEFIEGKSLKKLIREEGPLPVGRVLSIIKQSAAALEAANKLGMVHRDIKPDNIALVDAPEGELVKVLDFGIAKVKEARRDEQAGMTLTGAGVVIGTPQYMSPEQAMGKRGDELDGRADLYSLGVVMYQMLTADLPFKADTTMAMLLAHMQTPPAPIEELHPELNVPPSVAALAMRLLEKNRDNRPASASVLMREIERVEQGLVSPRPLPPPPPPEPEPTRVVRPDQWSQGPSGGSQRGGGADVVTRRTPLPTPLPPVEPRRIQPPPEFKPPVEPPRVPYPPPPPPQKESRWGIWAALVVLVVGIVVGAWFIFPHPKSSVVSAQLTAEPTVVEKGQPVKLVWSSQNATTLDLEPGVGPVAAEGSTSVTPANSTTYRLTATGPGGTEAPTAVVTVTPPQQQQEQQQQQQGQQQRVNTDDQERERQRQADLQRQRQAEQERQRQAELERQRQAELERQRQTEQQQIQAKVNGKITLGNFHYGRGEYDDAIATYREGLALDPKNARLQQLLEQAVKTCRAENKVMNEGFTCGGR